MKRLGALAGISFFLGALFYALIFGTGQEINRVSAAQMSEERPVSGLNKFSFAPLVKKVRPAVVKVLSRTLTRGYSRFSDSLFDRFMGRQRKKAVTGVGSGFLISPDGYIITNNHVVENALKVSIKMIDGSEYKADIVGKDPKTDLALLKVKGKNLPYISLGDSSKVEVGEWVLAIGNPLNQDLTVTSGIISAKGRQLGSVAEFVDFLQTDASINKGNSGGPLINMDGKVIGINSVILSQTGGNIGISFAIPSDMAKKIVGDLKKNGTVVRGWLGVNVQEYSEKDAKEEGLPMSGIMVGRVEADSPAKKGGLKKMDFIIKINGKRIKTNNGLRRLIGNSSPGTLLKVTVLRGNKNKEIVLKIKIGKSPENFKYRPSGSGDKLLDLGLVLKNNSPVLKREYGLTTDKGVVVTFVERGGFADDYGLKRGDIIFGLNRTEIESIEQFSEMIQDFKTGDIVRLWVNRDGYETSVRVRLPE